MERVILAALVAGVWGCSDGKDGGGDDEPACTIDDGALSGVINGASWTFAAGGTDSFLSDDEDFFASFYGEDDGDSCDYSSPEGASLIVSIPTSAGTYDFSSTLNGTFVFDGSDGVENYVTFDGVVVVDEVTDTTVTGSLCMIYDSDFEVSGSFSLDICAE